MINIAVLTSPDQWFVPYAQKICEEIDNASLFFEHEIIGTEFEVVFILAYHRIIEGRYLAMHKHNIVIHESALPKGKGWAPFFWQIIEGKAQIPFTMLEASENVDDGDIYMQETLTLTGFELNEELRAKQAEMSIRMCRKFIENYVRYQSPTKQSGTESFYPKRTPKDSRLDINKTLGEQFNLLRTVHNRDYPAFFEIDGHRYELKIERKC